MAGSRNLKSQLDGLFSDIVPGPEGEEEGESPKPLSGLLEGTAGVEPAVAESTMEELLAVEPVAEEPPVLEPVAAEAEVLEGLLAAEPVAEEPAAMEPEAPEPARFEPMAEEPVAVEPEMPEPLAEEPAPVEPETPEPAWFEPMAEEPAAVEPEAPEPVSEEPAIFEPVAPEPAWPEAVAEEPVSVEPVSEEPAIFEPVAEEPAVLEPAALEPMWTEPVAEEPVSVEPVLEEPAIFEPVAEEPAVLEPAALEPMWPEAVVEGPVSVEPVLEEPAIFEPVAEEPAVLEPAALEPAWPEAVAEEPVSVEPVSEEPAIFEPVAEEPAWPEAVVQEPAVEPVAEEPAIFEPVTPEPVWLEPVAEEPVPVEPVSEETAIFEPVTEESAVFEPVVEEPAWPEAVTEEPVSVEPVLEEPAVPEPVAPEPAWPEAAAREPAVEPAAEELGVKPEAPESEVEEPAWVAAIREQRTRILNTLLGIAAGIATPIIVSLVLFSIGQPSLWVSYIPYFVAWVVLVGLALARRLSPVVRTSVLVVLAYAVGILSLIIDGPLGAGWLYLLAAPMLFSILVQKKAGAYAAAVSLIVYIVAAVAHYLGWIQPIKALNVREGDVLLNVITTFGMLVATVTLIQWMFSSFLTSALKGAEERNAEAVRSRTLLEQRAEELAAANTLLQGRTIQLQTASDVAHSAASELDLDEWGQQAVDLIRERFGLYYVGLFLLDEAGEWAGLKAGTGEVGRRMLAQRYGVGAGDGSAVGLCVVDDQPYVALQEWVEPAWLSGLDDVGRLAISGEIISSLPGTQAEIALPLHSRGQVIGALDVHGAEPEVFSREAINTLHTLADQMAVAIDNARLLVELRQRLAEMEAAQRLYVREQWADLVPRQVAPFHQRTRADTRPLDDAMMPEVEKAIAERAIVVQSGAGNGGGQAALVAPITLRGEVIGVLGLQEAGDDRQWTEDEVALVEAVADQMALAIENIRLLDETERRADRERVTAEIATRVRASMSIENILQTAVRELGAALGTDRAFIKLGTVSQGTGGTGPLDIDALDNLPGDGWQENVDGRDEPVDERTSKEMSEQAP
jgi:GAF domain-containing protein